MQRSRGVAILTRPEGRAPHHHEHPRYFRDGLALDEDPGHEEEDEEPGDPVEETEDYKRLERLIRDEEKRRER